MSDKQKPKKIEEEVNSLLIEQLKAAGIETEGLSTLELVNKIGEINAKNKKLQEQLVDASQTREEEQKTLIAKKMTSYIQTHDSLLTDKSFVARLFTMGVPEVFLKLFRDYDSTISDAKIWEMVRKSSIKTYDHDMGELLSKRRPFGRKVEKTRFANEAN